MIIAFIVAKHLRAMIADLEDERPLNPVYRDLCNAGLIFLTEVTVALDDYFVLPNSEKLHRDLITSGMEFIQRWEKWIEDLGPGDLASKHSKILHGMLLRHCKGIIKAYRIWKIDVHSLN